MMTPESTVFVIIDFQQKLVAAMHEAEPVQANLCRLAAGAAALSVPLIVTEQYPDKLGATRPEVLDAGDAASVISKTTFSCAANQAFMESIEKRRPRHVVLAGIEAHVCVYQTARHLQEAGFQTSVVADAVTSRSAQNVEIALNRLRDKGIGVVSTEMVLFEMLTEASGPLFKAVLDIIK
jgi:nicotinamidase-related amidase